MKIIWSIQIANATSSAAEAIIAAADKDGAEFKSIVTTRTGGEILIERKNKAEYSCIFDVARAVVSSTNACISFGSICDCVLVVT